LLFELFADLHNDNEIKNQSKESVFIENREVCVHTGRPPNHFCNETHTDSYIPGISNTQICNHLLPVFISTDSSLSFCRTCLPNTTEYITAYYPDYPIELLSFWQTKGMYYKKTPPHYPYCKAVQSGSGPYIQSISNNATYLLDGLSRDSITLTSIANADVQMVYWFDNDELIAQVPPHKPAFWKPQKGKRFISVVDDKGRKSVATIHISFY
jgi:penicillin-binding protein 1C